MSLFKKIIALSFIGFFAVSCKMMKSNHLPNKPLDSGQLGAIGKFSNSGLLSKKFEEVGAIKLIKPIKVKVNAIHNKLKKIDSVNSKLKDETVHLNLKIIDKINFIANLNSTENGNYLNFLKENNDTFIRTEGIWIFNSEQAASLLNAQSIYLVNNGLSNYALQLSMTNGEVRKIYFQNSKIYKANYINACWKENIKGEVIIAALKNKRQKCPGNTEENLKNLEKEDLFDQINN